MSNKIGKILAVDDNEDILFTLKLLLKNEVELIRSTTNPENIPSMMEKEEFDIILLDMNFTKDAISGKEGYYWLRKILEIDKNAVVLFITAYGDIERSVRAIKEGATDFIIKPWGNEKIMTTIKSAINLRLSKKELARLQSTQKEFNKVLAQPFTNFIGRSQGMMEVFDCIKKVAQTDANVLILGENGTGKELVARALHQQSRRASDIFVSVDMGSINENLFESELFGHVKGAFTDARDDRLGRFEIASGGSIFLDEIGNLSLPVQAKLLTILEQRQVTRVGSNKTTDIDVRLICATNSDLEKHIEEGTFRQDLLYRMNTVEITIPPLRDRIDDIPLLANHFLDLYSKKYKKKFKPIPKDTLDKLCSFNWPGNVRELQHVIERGVIMSDDNILYPGDLNLKKNKNNSSSSDKFDTYNLDEVEKQLIQKAMTRHGGNISKAASDLGLTRTSLYRRLEKHGL
jgi:DNA-binding NtrC family response regulator